MRTVFSKKPYLIDFIGQYSNEGVAIELLGLHLNDFSYNRH